MASAITVEQKPRIREYETIYILRPTVTRDSAGRVSKRVADVLERENGKLTLVETWGRRQLAYPIGNHKRGVYVYVRYLGGGELVSELERNMRMLDDVVRFQTVQVRDEVDVAAVQVNPEEVQFEEIEEIEEEAEESLERSLGLAEDEPERSHAAPRPQAEAAAEPSEGGEKSAGGEKPAAGEKPAGGEKPAAGEPETADSGKGTEEGEE